MLLASEEWVSSRPSNARERVVLTLGVCNAYLMSAVGQESDVSLVCRVKAGGGVIIE